MKKAALLIMFIALIVTVYFFTPAKHYLSGQGIQELRGWIDDLGILAPLVFGLIYVGATVLALPGSILTITGGLVFGTIGGTAVNLISATTGACLCFLLSRYLGRDFVKKLLRNQKLLDGLDQKIGEHGFYSVLYLRLIPLFPFNGLNFGLGLTRIRFVHYALASLIGMLPGCFAYTALGAAGQHISLTSLESWKDIRAWGPFLLVILLTLIARFFKKKVRKT